jgi:bacteriocin-like protein
MKTITTNDLNTVYGGASKKADGDVTAQLTALQGSIKDLSSNNTKSSSDSMLPLLMVMALGNKQQQGPTVVSAGAAAPVVAGGPVVNISNRVRRW